MIRTLDKVAAPNDNWSSDAPDSATSQAPYRLYNIGNNQPVALMDYIETIEKAIGKAAIKNFLPLQPGDVPETYADVDALSEDVGYRPATPIATGVEAFVTWYKAFYQC